jgi:Uncharacterized protein conserved in bacteria
MRVLLHSCCGPCASHCLLALRDAGHEPVLFFSNSNIAPSEEFERRLAALRQLADATAAEVVVDPPDHARWLEEVAAGYEDCREGGARCARCFRFSLRRAAESLDRLGAEAFTTSLTVSPHKRSASVFEAGREVGGDRFLPVDFKKRDGFLHSIKLAEQYGLYRQNYCGCEFSVRKEASH